MIYNISTDPESWGQDATTETAQRASEILRDMATAEFRSSVDAGRLTIGLTTGPEMHDADSDNMGLFYALEHFMEQKFPVALGRAIEELTAPRCEMPTCEGLAEDVRDGHAVCRGCAEYIDDGGVPNWNGDEPEDGTCETCGALIESREDRRGHTEAFCPCCDAGEMRAFSRGGN